MIGAVAVHVALWAMLSPAVAPVGAGPWQEVARDGDIVVVARAVAGSDFEELRATAPMPVPPAAMMDLMWGDGSLRDASPGVTSRELLKNEPRERLYYETVQAPMISTRDYVLRVTRDDVAHVIAFRSVDDPRRPPVKGWVRMPRIVGSTAAVADGAGCRVVHTVFSETGGDLPAWLAKGGARDNMVAWLKALRARAKARAR